MGLYDLLVLGCPDSEVRDPFTRILLELIEESGISTGDVRLITDSSGYLGTRNPRVPTVVACFSDLSEDELTTVTALVAERVPTIPIATNGERFEDFPDLLRPLNGAALTDHAESWATAGAAVLESIGLLRAQRRLFISYRRTEAREAAVQLYDEMAARGFQVFLDTHSIRPGKVFQDELWHSLSDSDVMVMLDTETYFESKWTREEFGRAQNMGVSIMRLVWPGVSPERTAELSEERKLSDVDFDGELLTAHVLREVVEIVEWLRARGLASRYKEITGKLKAGIEAIGAKLNGAGAFRSLSIQLGPGLDIWAYPVIGVPTASMMHDIALKAAESRQARPYLVFDHTGITAEWLTHLGWLDKYIDDVDIMRVSDAANILGRRAAG